MLDFGGFWIYEPHVANHNRRDRLVALSEVTNDFGGVGISPDIVLGNCDTSLFQLMAESRAEWTSWPPVKVNGVRHEPSR